MPFYLEADSLSRDYLLYWWRPPDTVRYVNQWYIRLLSCSRCTNDLEFERCELKGDGRTLRVCPSPGTQASKGIMEGQVWGQR